MDQIGMDSLTGRAEALIAAITGGIMSAVETAADRISVASELARVNQRLVAFSAAIEALAAQKEALTARLAKARGPMRAFLTQQLGVLTAQEVGILRRVGLADADAAAAVEAADGPAYRRLGSRFVRAGVNGGGDAHAGDGAASSSAG